MRAATPKVSETALKVDLSCLGHDQFGMHEAFPDSINPF